MKEGRKEMFHLTIHFYLRLYGVRHMVKEHSDSQRGNPLPTHGLLFSINSKGSFIFVLETVPRFEPSTYQKPLCHEDQLPSLYLYCTFKHCQPSAPVIRDNSLETLSAELVTRTQRSNGVISPRLALFI